MSKERFGGDPDEKIREGAWADDGGLVEAEAAASETAARLEGGKDKIRTTGSAEGTQEIEEAVWLDDGGLPADGGDAEAGGSPTARVEILEPLSETERDALRRSIGYTDVAQVGVHHMVSGPGGQMISGQPGA